MDIDLQNLGIQSFKNCTQSFALSNQKLGNCMASGDFNNNIKHSR